MVGDGAAVVDRGAGVGGNELIKHLNGCLGLAFAHPCHAKAEQQARIFGVCLQQHLKTADGLVIPLQGHRGLHQPDAHCGYRTLQLRIFFSLGHGSVEALQRGCKLPQRCLGFASVVIQGGLCVPLRLCRGKSLKCFRVLFLELQNHARVKACTASQFAQVSKGCRSRQVPLRLVCHALAQVVGPQIQKRAAAPNGIGGGFDINLLGSIGPCGDFVAQRKVALQGQRPKQQPQHSAQGIDCFGLEAGEHNRQQARKRHCPQVAAIKHKRVLHPDGDELRGKPQKWKKKEYRSKTQCACATKQQPRGPCKERQICHRASQVPGRCKAQRKGGTQVDRHPANIGHDPEQPVCKEEPCLIQDAQGKNLLRNARAKRFELLRKGHRLRIKEPTNQVAAKVQQCGSGHAHQQKCSTQHDGNALPAGAPYVDVDRNGQGGGHHRMLFGQHGQQIGQQCACVPRHSLGLQSTHKGPACEHGKQGCHEDGSLDQVAHRVNRHGVECKQCHPNLQCSPLRCGKVRLVLHVLRETGAGHQRLEEHVHRCHHAQVQYKVDDALLPPASAREVFHPNEAAVRNHALLDVQQVSIDAKNGAFR